MYPEDRVLVGVVNSRRDLLFARNAGWYRIPVGQMPFGVDEEYIAFFLSGNTFGQQSGSISYYARRVGVELMRRRDLVTTQPEHPRANHLYYQVMIDSLRVKNPPIHNMSNRRFAFIRTTWDRFSEAESLDDLYRESTYYVDRIYRNARQCP